MTEKRSRIHESHQIRNITARKRSTTEDLANIMLVFTGTLLPRAPKIIGEVTDGDKYAAPTDTPTLTWLDGYSSNYLMGTLGDYVSEELLKNRTPAELINIAFQAGVLAAQQGLVTSPKSAEAS